MTRRSTRGVGPASAGRSDARPGNAPDDHEADPESVARSIVLRRLSAAPQTRAQLAEAMTKRAVPVEVQDAVLDRFSDVGLIDDAAFARAWVESRHLGRGLAGRALTDELRRRGVAPEVAGEAVEALSPEREEDTARALVAKRLASTRRLDATARTRRLVSMLVRKGYSPSLAFRLVREALEAEGLPADAGLDHHADDPIVVDDDA